MKTFLSNTIVKWYKRFGFAGAARWRLLYWTYKIWPGLHIRHKEWDWTLEYLPKLAPRQKIRALDVGATSSLFLYELRRRGYEVSAMDLRPYQEKLPKKISFYQEDIGELASFFCYMENGRFDFIVCISVLEHVEKKGKAIENMCRMLKPGGRLLLTIPTEEYAQGHPWLGFTYDYIRCLLDGTDTKIISYTERAGQMCLAIGKCDGRL